MDLLRSMPRRLSRAFGIPSLVLFGAVLTLGLSSNVLADLASATGGVTLEVILLVGLLAATVWAYSRWESTLPTAGTGTRGGTKLTHRRGVILLVGLDSATSPAVTHLLHGAAALTHVAFIGTPQTASRGVVATIRHQLAPALGRDLAEDHVLVSEGNQAEWIVDNERAVAAAIDWMHARGIPSEQIVVDVSHGRRPMGFGALLAAETAGVEVQYWTCAWNHAANVPDGAYEFKIVRELFPHA